MFKEEAKAMFVYAFAFILIGLLATLIAPSLFHKFHKKQTSQELVKSVVELNNQSKRSLGVSLNALNYLRDASPNHYIPLWALEESGDINLIRELENKGYVTSRIVVGLPNGTEKDSKFLIITPTDTGGEIKKSFLALKPIKTLPPRD